MCSGPFTAGTAVAPVHPFTADTAVAPGRLAPRFRSGSDKRGGLSPVSDRPGSVPYRRGGRWRAGGARRTLIAQVTSCNSIRCGCRACSSG